MNITEMIVTAEAKKGFYPTPKSVADKLLDGINWHRVSAVLEPSAGKGDLAYKVMSKIYLADNRSASIDFVEIDPYLRSILQYRFGGQQRGEFQDRLEQIRTAEYKAGNYPPKSPEYHRLDMEHHILSVPCRICHDDFLTYDTRKRYDLIVMNPPFADGDAHLLKALSLIKDSGGEVRCILNAETIRNPYTARRKALAAKLEELNAEISYMDSGFLDAERKTDVTIALIQVNVPKQERKSEIFSRLWKAAGLDETSGSEPTEIAVQDVIDRLIASYNVEADAGLALIREYKAMQPYLLTSLRDTKYAGQTLKLSVGEDSLNKVPDGNAYLRLVRSKYWRALLTNPDFMGKLTSDLRSKYLDMVSELKDYDFSRYNIETIMREMNAEMEQSVKDTIVNLFDQMTAKFTWYPEMEKNIHYFNGWATNKAHMINSKVILPVNGIFSDYMWSKTFEVNRACDVLSDIEKVFEYLDGNLSAPVNLHYALDSACREGRTKNISCKFFDVTFYKKGTMHLKFKNPKLVERFNIYCAQQKAWLPPVYGKVRYSDLQEDAKVVVDSFHGTGESGSGEAGYQEIMANAGYFLAPPTGGGNMLALDA